MTNDLIRRTRSLLVPAASLATMALVATPLAAQSSLRLVPQVGVYVPMSDLGRVDSADGAVDIAKMESTLGFGLALEVLPRSSVSFRLGGAFGTDSDVPVSGIGCTACKARGTVLTVTGAAVLRPVPASIPLRPYLLAGAGLKSYNFRYDASLGNHAEAFVNDQTHATIQLGAGIELNLGLLRLLLEASDYTSGFRLGDDSATGEAKRQHDIFITVGVAAGG
jgi:hypothetical protein